MTKHDIYCCGCGKTVAARLTNGFEVYPHAKSMYRYPFWKCDGCGNYVGCHHKTTNRTVPLGCIPTPELRKARQKVHGLLDPLWRKGGPMSRGDVYRGLSKLLGYPFHTAELRSVEQAELVCEWLLSIGGGYYSATRRTAELNKEPTP